MHIRVFTLRFDDLLGGFDDAPLQDFIRDKEVIAIRDHFFVREGHPFLALVVTYSLGRPPYPSANEKRGKKAREAACAGCGRPNNNSPLRLVGLWLDEGGGLFCQVS